MTADLSALDAATATFGRGVAIASFGSSRRDRAAVEEDVFPFFCATDFVFAEAAALPALAATTALPPFFPLLPAATAVLRDVFAGFAAAAALASARRATAVSFSQPALGAVARRAGAGAATADDSDSGTGMGTAPISGVPAFTVRTV